MAKYQRAFLIPHLKDICALHLALGKLEERLDMLENQKRSMERAPFRIYPMKPCYEAENGVFFLCMGAFSLMMAFWMFWDRIIAFGLFCTLIAFMSLTVGGIRYIQVTRENEKKEALYKQKLATYQESQQKQASRKKEIPGLDREIEACEKEILRAKATLQSLYGANIIPPEYQTAKAAMFLHIWFGNGTPNDLDTALQVFSLLGEENQVNGGTADQSEDMIAQYLQFAEQGKSPDGERMTRKLNQLFLTEEERDTYQAIIRGNLATMEYFSTAKYL